MFIWSFLIYQQVSFYKTGTFMFPILPLNTTINLQEGRYGNVVE